MFNGPDGKVASSSLILNVVTGFALQEGCEVEEKEMDEEIQGISRGGMKFAK